MLKSAAKKKVLLVNAGNRLKDQRDEIILNLLSIPQESAIFKKSFDHRYDQYDRFTANYKDTSLCLICCDLSEEEPFKQVEDWKSEIHYYSTSSSFLIVGLNRDQAKSEHYNAKQLYEKEGYIEFPTQRQNHDYQMLMKAILEKIRPEEPTEELPLENIENNIGSKKRCTLS